MWDSAVEISPKAFSGESFSNSKLSFEVVHEMGIFWSQTIFNKFQTRIQLKINKKLKYLQILEC